MASVDSGRGDDVLIKSGGSPRKNAALAAVCVALALSGANMQAQIISLAIAAREKTSLGCLCRHPLFTAKGSQITHCLTRDGVCGSPVAGAAFPSASHADMVIDQYGVQKQRICPVSDDSFPEHDRDLNRTAISLAAGRGEHM